MPMRTGPPNGRQNVPTPCVHCRQSVSILLYRRAIQAFELSGPHTLSGICTTTRPVWDAPSTSHVRWSPFPPRHCPLNGLKPSSRVSMNSADRYILCRCPKSGSRRRAAADKRVSAAAAVPGRDGVGRGGPTTVPSQSVGTQWRQMTMTPSAIRHRRVRRWSQLSSVRNGPAADPWTRGNAGSWRLPLLIRGL